MSSTSIRNSLVIVQHPDRDDPSWLGFMDDEGRLWTYVADTDRFHLNPAVHADYYADIPHMEYWKVGVDEGRRLVGTGVGTVSTDRSLTKLKSEPSMPVSAVLAKVTAESPTPPDGAPPGRASARHNHSVDGPRVSRSE